MIFKSESIPSQFIHALTDIKLKDDDPLKIWFDAIEWIPIHPISLNYKGFANDFKQR